MATFFKPSPSILCPSPSKGVDASRSARPAHPFVLSSDLSSPNDNGAAVNVVIEAQSRTLAAVGCFSEEKAKQLHRKTAEGYASIASRLATNVSCPSRFE